MQEYLKEKNITAISDQEDFQKYQIEKFKELEN